MNQQQEAEKIVRGLAKNAALIKTKIAEGNLKEAAVLMGERVSLVEALGALREAKVSLANSDVIDEMNILMEKAGNDVSESAGAIRTRLSALSRELGNMKGAKNIASYKVQGGRYGY